LSTISEDDKYNCNSKTTFQSVADLIMAGALGWRTVIMVDQLRGRQLASGTAVRRIGCFTHRAAHRLWEIPAMELDMGIQGIDMVSLKIRNIDTS
jgi:hypothetical protein